MQDLVRIFVKRNGTSVARLLARGTRQRGDTIDHAGALAESGRRAVFAPNDNHSVRAVSTTRTGMDATLQPLHKAHVGRVLVADPLDEPRHARSSLDFGIE